MRQGRGRRCRAHPWIELLLPLLMVAPLAAAAEEMPFADAGAAAKDAGRWPYSLAAPLAAAEEAPFADAGAAAKDAGRWSYSLVAPLAAAEEVPFVVAGAEAGSARPRPYAQTAPSEPGEEAPIPIEGAVPSEPGPWPYALPFLADRVIKQGYSLPLPRGLSLIYTYIQRDIKISSVSLGVNGAPLRDVTSFVNLGSTSHVSVAVARFDAWLLPFLNVYALAGYVSNNTTTRGIVTIPNADAEGRSHGRFKLTKTTGTGRFCRWGRSHLGGWLARFFHPRRLQLQPDRHRVRQAIPRPDRHRSQWLERQCPGHPPASVVGGIVLGHQGHREGDRGGA